MPKLKIVVTNPVDKIDAERLKNLIAEGNNRGKPPIEDKKDGKGKVKRKKKSNTTIVNNGNGDLNSNPPTNPISPDSAKSSNDTPIPNGKKSYRVIPIPLTKQKTTEVGDPDYGRFAYDLIKSANTYIKTPEGLDMAGTLPRDMYDLMIQRRLTPNNVYDFLDRQAAGIAKVKPDSKFAKNSYNDVRGDDYNTASFDLDNDNYLLQKQLNKNNKKYQPISTYTELDALNPPEKGIPRLFWGAIIGAGVNMASSLIGGNKAKKQAAEQAKIAEQERLKAEAEANLASDQVQLKSYVPSNNPGYFAAGGTIENNSFTPNQYGVNISPNAQFLTNADGSTNGDHSTGNEVPIYNKDKKLIALAHPREILYTKPDGDQVVLSEARGYSTAYNNLQNMINERKVKLFKTRKDPKGDISRDIQDLVKAQVGLVAKQEEDSANPNQMKYGGKVRRKEDGDNTNSDFPPTNEYNRQLNMLPGILNKMNSFTDNIQRNIENSMIGINNSDNKVTSSNTDVVNTDPSKPWRNPNIPTIKPSIILEQEPLTGNQLNRRVTHYNDPSSPENQTFWDKAKGVMRTPEFQNAAIGTIGNVASNLISNSYLSAADKMISNLKPVHTRYAPINERVDVSGQEASAQNAFNLAKSEIDNVSDPTRRAALLNDLTSRYVSNNNEIAGNRINAEIAKQNTNVNAANQVSAQNAVASNAFNQYKAESRAGILGAKATNMGNMMTKIMQGVQDYRLGQNDKAKLDMVLQRFKSGVADRMDYDALENIFGIIKGNNKDGK